MTPLFNLLNVFVRRRFAASFTKGSEEEKRVLNVMRGFRSLQVSFPLE